jgi:arylesterase/paraoxonase
MVVKVTNNTDADKFYGKKFKIQRVFENDGKLISGPSAIAIHDASNQALITGVYDKSIVCQIKL